MQFAYQFPQLVERLILVGSGGVTKDVNIALRIASVPLGSEALALLRLPLGLPRMRVGGRVGGAGCGSPPLGRDLPDVLRILADLPEPTASSAFARTLRAVVDWRGQVVTMLDRCYLTQSVPVQLIWGARDSVIPVSHAKMAHSAMPGSLLEIFEGSGHFPFHDDPDRFVEVVERFIDSTEPAHYDQEQLRNLLRTGISEGAITGSVDTRVAVLDAMDADERSATFPSADRHVVASALGHRRDSAARLHRRARQVRQPPRRRRRQHSGSGRPPADSHPVGLQRNDIHRSARAGSEHRTHADLYACDRTAVRGAPDRRRFVVPARARSE